MTILSADDLPFSPHRFPDPHSSSCHREAEVDERVADKNPEQYHLAVEATSPIVHKSASKEAAPTIRPTL